MLHQTRGIVLHQVKYSDTSVIVKIYTELFGLQSYLVRGIKRKNAAIKSALLQHLTLIDLVVYHKPKSNIQHIKELKIEIPFQSIPYDIRKSSIALFINEILYNVVREEESNKDLFNFLNHSIQFLDISETNTANFHLLFLIKLSQFLGFYPKNNFSDSSTCFSLEEGNFTSQKGPENLFIPLPYSQYIYDLTQSTFEDLKLFQINPSQKYQLLEIILNYYRLHLPVTLNIKSHLVLKTVLND
jgi:DNA repair protein RecO (recombination protein O)